MRRHSLLAGAALAAALTAACGKPAPEESAPAVTLAPPEPSSATVTSPLGAVTTDYTNEMQAQNLRDQAAALGIDKFNSPRRSDEDEDDTPVSTEEGLARTRRLTRDLAAQRRAIDKDRDKTVVIPHDTPALIPSRKAGAPIEDDPAPAEPKDPETK